MGILERKRLCVDKAYNNEPAGEIAGDCVRGKARQKKSCVGDPCVGKLKNNIFIVLLCSYFPPEESQ